MVYDFSLSLLAALTCERGSTQVSYPLTHQLQPVRFGEGLQRQQLHQHDGSEGETAGEEDPVKDAEDIQKRVVRGGEKYGRTAGSAQYHADSVRFGNVGPGLVAGPTEKNLTAFEGKS
jgi:hypothetical protein